MIEPAAEDIAEVLAGFGFESGLKPGNQPDAAARFLLAVFPPILMVISFVFSFFIDFAQPEAKPVLMPDASGDD